MAANLSIVTDSAPAHVLMLGKTLDDLGEEWVAEDGKLYVVLSMSVEDMRRLQPPRLLFQDVTITVSPKSE